MRTVKDKDIDPNDPEIVLPPPKLPVGVIPSGSTDTVAYSLHGTIDVQTAVIHIIFGDTAGLDLSSVHSNRSLLRLYASVLSYGYLGDVMQDSEKFRWMGPQRYDYSGTDSNLIYCRLMFAKYFYTSLILYFHSVIQFISLYIYCSVILNLFPFFIFSFTCFLLFQSLILSFL